MEIEVGKYVRSKINGLISKVTDIETFEELGQIVERYILDNNYNKGFCSTEKDSVIVSKNIIDLIEVGDYVNGVKVANCGKGVFVRRIVQLENNYVITNVDDCKVRSIVTKEQFKSIEYKVGE